MKKLTIIFILLLAATFSIKAQIAAPLNVQDFRISAYYADTRTEAKEVTFTLKTDKTELEVYLHLDGLLSAAVNTTQYSMIETAAGVYQSTVSFPKNSPTHILMFC